MSWLQNYLDYTEHQQSPELFHFWVGLTTMASVVRKNVWTPRRSAGVTWYNTYPGQLMTVLVSPSGKGRKGTAMRCGRRIMSECGVKVVKGKGSTEKIITILSNHGQATQRGTRISTVPPDAEGIIIAPELSVLLSRQTYAEGIVDFLTDIYDADGDFDYMTQTGGIITLKNPCITFLAGATPTSIGKNIPEKAQETGYLGRVLHIYHNGDGKPVDPLSDLDDAEVDISLLKRNSALEKTLVEDLKEIGKITGAFSYSKEGKRWFDEWNKSWNESPAGSGEGYATRRPDHLLRVSMLLNLSDKKDLIHHENQLIAADNFLMKIEVGFPLAFAYIGQSMAAQKHERIRETIRSRGGTITSTDLYNQVIKYFDSIDDLKLAIKTLQEAGQIRNLGVINNEETIAMV